MSKNTRRVEGGSKGIAQGGQPGWLSIPTHLQAIIYTRVLTGVGRWPAGCTCTRTVKCSHIRSKNSRRYTYSTKISVGDHRLHADGRLGMGLGFIRDIPCGIGIWGKNPLSDSRRVLSRVRSKLELQRTARAPKVDPRVPRSATHFGSTVPSRHFALVATASSQRL